MEHKKPSHMKSLRGSTCDLCGLSLRFGARELVLQDKTFRFCCIGCRQVFRMLADISDVSDPALFQETDIFKQCRAMGIIPSSESDLEDLYTDPPPPDEPDEIDIPDDDGRYLKLRLAVEGMWCPACAWVIEHSLLKTPGVAKATCNFSTDRVNVRFDPVKTSPPQVAKAIKDLGYTATAPGDEIESSEKRTEFIRFGLSAFLTMNVMMLSFALYSGFFTTLTASDINYISWPIAVMATVVIVYGGKKLHIKGWAGWRSMGFGMETLISAGSLSAYFYSLYNFFFGSIHLYFDTASMLIVLVLLGKLLEAKAKERVTRDLESFFSLVPNKARIVSPEAPCGRYVSAQYLEKGSLFVLEENEISPADGVVVHGKCEMDESTLTGEARPIKKKIGDRVRSGTRLISGRITVEAESVGEDSTLGRMIEIMEKALGKKTPLEGKTDIALEWFAPGIFTVAFAVGLAGWLLGLTPDQAVVRAVTVMVISCPCALGIAIPLARTAGISLAARNGILVRDFSAFETAPKIDTFVFDKTGSMTEGDWNLLDVEHDPAWDREQVIAAAFALEQNSDHHAAIKIKQYARRKNIRPASVEDIRFHENGVSGTFRNKPIKIGSAQFLSEETTQADQDPTFPRNLEKNNLEISAMGLVFTSAVRTLPRSPHSHASRGNAYPDALRPRSAKTWPNIEPTPSAIHMAFDGKTVACFLFGDRIKKGASETIRNLRDRGFRTFLVSGDGKASTKSVAKEIGIQTAYGEMLPEEKANFVDALAQQGNVVAMGGDGVNDAPALARADLAIAFHSGSRLGREAAHVTLMRGEPSQVVDFLNLARKVTGKIHQNLAFSFLYNAISIPIAAAGLLSPLVAVCAMLLSSISVTGNTALLLKKGADRIKRCGLNSSGLL